MYSEPAEESITTMVEMGVASSREEAVHKLKMNANDLHRAIETHFENASAAGQTNPTDVGNYDERQFHTDRDNSNNHNSESFTINSPDVLRPGVFAAPSRPPSRNSSKTPVYDLSKEHEAADPNTSMSADEHDLQQALKLSMSDMGPQEQGVTGQASSNFGPAMREHYDPSQWAVTKHSEVAPIPDPADRKRAPGEPAVISPSVECSYLAPLVTILNSVPLAREALLSSNHVLSDYGYDSEWWHGSPAKVSKTIDLEDDVAWTKDDAVHETQRLVAFLDQTERSYASIDNLVKARPVMSRRESEILDAFMQIWQGGTLGGKLPSSSPSIFTSTGVKESDADGELHRSSLNILELLLDNDIADAGQTLYDAIDQHVWEGTPLDDNCGVYLDVVADVFTVCISKMDVNNPHRGIQIPAVWYADRYLQKNQQLARGLREQKAKVAEKIMDLELRKRLVTEYNPPGGVASVDPRELLKTAISHLEEPVPPIDSSSVVGPGQHNKLDGENTTMSTTALVQELRKISDKAVDKLAALEEQRKSATAKLTELSAWMTSPAEDPTLDPTHRYHLRGVATTPQVSYVLQPVGSLASSVDEEMSYDGQQWWRIDFSVADPKFVNKRRVTEENVLEAARGEGRSVLLVYARTNGTETPNAKTLPASLQAFVDADNHTFAAELSGASTARSDGSSHSRESLKDRTAQQQPTPDGRGVHWGGVSPPSSDYPGVDLSDDFSCFPNNGTFGSDPTNLSGMGEEYAVVGQEMEEKGGSKSGIAAAAMQSTRATDFIINENDGDSRMKDVHYEERT